MSPPDETATAPPPSASELVAGLIAPAMRRLEVSRILAQSGSAASISVDQIRLGDAMIERLHLRDVNATLDAGETRLENIRVLLRITAGLRFRVFGISRTRSATFGFPLSIGDVRVPRLDDIVLEVPSATVTDAQIEVQPVSNLHLGAAQFTDLRVEGTDLPAAGFALDGLAVEGFDLHDVDVPASFTQALSVGTFAPARPLNLPTAIITGVQLPEVVAPRVSSSGSIGIPNVIPEDLERRARLDLILLSVELFVRPVLDLQISALTINDIRAVSSIDRITIEDISAPVTISGLRLGELELREVTVNRVVV